MSVDVAATQVVNAILQPGAALSNHCCCSFQSHSKVDRPASDSFGWLMRVFVTMNFDSRLVPYGVTQRRFYACGRGCIRWQQRMRRTSAGRVWIEFSDRHLIGVPLHNRNANKPKHRFYPFADHSVRAIVASQDLSKHCSVWTRHLVVASSTDWNCTIVESDLLSKMAMKCLWHLPDSTAGCGSNSTDNDIKTFAINAKNRFLPFMLVTIWP